MFNFDENIYKVRICQSIFYIDISSHLFKVMFSQCFQLRLKICLMWS